MHAWLIRPCRRAWVGRFFMAVIWSAPWVAARAQTTPTLEPAPTATPAGPADEFQRGVPRSAVRGYLEACWASDYQKAAAYLDLRRLPQAEREAEGPTLARELCTVIDRTVWVDPELLSDEKEGVRDDGLPPRRDLVGTIPTAEEAVQILIERVPRDDGVLVWKISSTTVAKVPRLYEEFSYGFAEHLPAVLRDLRFLQIQLWQWIGLIALLGFATGLSWLITLVMVRVLRAITARTHSGIDDRMLEAAKGPLWLATGATIFYAGTSALAFSARARSLVAECGTVIALVALTWVMLRLIDVVSRVIEDYYVAPRRHMASLVPLFRRTVKVFLVLLAVLATLQNLGFNVTSLLAGLGIGGLAVALAAQKTVEHLFGSVTLVTDAPVRVGDVCRFGDQLGTVEDIGLRSTRVRTPDRTVVSIPNAEFASMQIENFSKRDRIRLYATLGMRYETTPDQLRYLLVELKKLLLGHPKIDPTPARVRFVGFGAYSLDIEIFALVLTDDHEEFLAVREDLFLRIMDLVAASGTGFAFPSQITYLASDGGIDAEKTRAAEAQVRAWRETDELCLPDFPPDRAAALRGRIKYPPPGAAGRR